MKVRGTMDNHVSYLGSCRGDGKIYALLSIGQADGLKIENVTASGTSLPFSLIKLNQNQFVLVLSDFSVNQSISIFDSSGNRLFHRSFCSFLLAFESKVNGVLRRELCEQIRNIDRSGLESKASISIDHFVPSVDGLILRGSFSAFADLPFNKLVALDPEGELIGSSQFLLDRKALDGADRIPFSIYLPELKESLCISAVDASGNHLGVFVSFKKDILKSFCEITKKEFCTAFDDVRYRDWICRNRLTGSEANEQRLTTFSHSPLFSIIVPLYKTPLNFFVDMADSVLAQTYQNWELILVNSTPEERPLHELVDRYVEMDSRIVSVELEMNFGITANTNKGIERAKGDYLCFFDHDDVLEPDILFEYVKAINDNPDIALLYCDEDKLMPDGSLANPTFKPDFSLDMVRDNNYICHLLTVKTNLLSQIEASESDLDGAQDHAMVLKIAELNCKIHHVSKILYHWRISENSTAGNSDSKPYASIAGIKAVQQHLDRCGLSASVSLSHERAFRYSPDYAINENTKLSIIVVSKGEDSTLARLVSSLNSIDIDDAEVVFVGSKECFNSFEKAASLCRFPVLVELRDDCFNLAVWRNAGAERSSGNVYIFIHDDVVPQDSRWARVLVGFAQRSDVGIVGTMTCDSDGVIRQAGLSHVGDSIIELSKGFHSSTPGYIYFPLTVRDVAAVDGACFATSKESFDLIGGFDEGYQLDYSEIDYCFKLSELGKKVLYTPEAAQVHFACVDSLLDTDKRSRKHYEDKARLLGLWSQVFARGDRWFSPWFSRLPGSAEKYKLGGFI